MLRVGPGHPTWIAETVAPLLQSGGRWSGQQDSNLPQLIVVTQYDSDQQLHLRAGGPPEWAEVLTFLRRASRCDKEVSDRLPDPGNGCGSAVTTSTGAEIHGVDEKAIESANSLKRTSIFNSQTFLKGPRKPARRASGGDRKSPRNEKPPGRGDGPGGEKATLPT